jgi:hypothetical protein
MPKKKKKKSSKKHGNTGKSYDSGLTEEQQAIADKPVVSLRTQELRELYNG